MNHKISDPPSVSIIIPTYNPDPELLQEALNSAVTQSVPRSRYEVLVVDDGSDDHHAAQIEHLCAHFSVTLVINAQNLGLNLARKSGVAASRSEWVLFLDSDDLLTSDALEIMLSLVSNRTVDAVFGAMYKLNLDSGVAAPLPITRKKMPDANERVLAAMRGEMSFTMCGRLFRRSLLKDEIFDMPSRIYHEDCVTLPRLLAVAGQIHVEPRPLYFYRTNEDSITGQTTAAHIHSLVEIAKSWEQLIEANGYSDRAYDSLRTGVERLYSTILIRSLIEGRVSPDIQSATSRLEATLERFPRSRPTNLVQKYLLPTETTAKIQRSWTQTALHLKDKVVIIGLVDYQIRAALHLARGLRDAGQPVIVIDFSQKNAGGQRKYRSAKEDASLRHRVELLRRDASFLPADLLTARLVITLNDFNPFVRDALETRRAAGLPSVAMIEGINDFDRVDATNASVPYRRSTHRALAGSDDQRFFDQETSRVIGLPLIAESVNDRLHSPPKNNPRRVILNVNFTYGVLEDERRAWVLSVIQACERRNLELVITRHPMDKGAEGERYESKLSQSELLRQGGIYVSRFGTGILEALALGIPTIYFPPSGEKVDKFFNSLGAFSVVRNADQLSDALDEIVEKISRGHDFIESASDFLLTHCDIDITSADNLSQIRERMVRYCFKLIDDSHERSLYLNSRWIPQMTTLSVAT